MRPITDTLRHLDHGNLLDDASEKLAELVKNVDASGKPGSLTITIKVRKAAVGALAITGKVDVKTPAAPVLENLMFATVDGDLLTEDPRQSKLDLKAVAVTPTTLATVTPETTTLRKVN